MNGWLYLEGGRRTTALLFMTWEHCWDLQGPNWNVLAENERRISLQFGVSCGVPDSTVLLQW
jgi:hypothetical protein